MKLKNRRRLEYNATYEIACNPVQFWLNSTLSVIGVKTSRRLVYYIPIWSRNIATNCHHTSNSSWSSIATVFHTQYIFGLDSSIKCPSNFIKCPLYSSILVSNCFTNAKMILDPNIDKSFVFASETDGDCGIKHRSLSTLFTRASRALAS